MADDSTDRSSQLTRVAIPLKWPVRAVVVTAGVICLGAGGTATFVTSVEAGPVALITAGVIFGLIGAAGVVPTRIRAGDYEAEFTQEQRIARVLTDAIDSAPEEDKPKVAQVVEAVGEVAPAVAAPALRAYETERDVLAELDKVVKDIPGASLVREATDAVAGQFDAIVSVAPAELTPGTRHLLVEVKRSLAAADVRLLTGKADAYARAHPGTRTSLVILLMGKASHAAQSLVREFEWVTMTWYAGPLDDVFAERAVSSAMAGTFLTYPTPQSRPQRTQPSPPGS